MILVDTSVLINYFRGKDTPKTRLFNEIAKRGYVYGISPYTYQELLQGAKDEHEYRLLKEYLDAQNFYFLPPSLESFERAAQ